MIYWMSYEDCLAAVQSFGDAGGLKADQNNIRGEAFGVELSTISIVGSKGYEVCLTVVKPLFSTSSDPTKIDRLKGEFAETLKHHVAKVGTLQSLSIS